MSSHDHSSRWPAPQACKCALQVILGRTRMAPLMADEKACASAQLPVFARVLDDLPSTAVLHASTNSYRGTKERKDSIASP